MTTFELIDSFGENAAILLPTDPGVERLLLLYRLVSPRAHLAPTLAKRWNLWGVIATTDWAHEQLARVPMLRPRGLKLAFLDSP